MVATYEDLANEYYDAERHPTCASFRAASRVLLDAWVPRADLGGDLWDVGAGDSLLAELLDSRGDPLDRLAILDSSESMLRYSEPWRERGARLVLAPASGVPALDGSAALVVSSLGDPYNGPAFWAEVARLLAPGGTCLFTSPSYDWSTRFRASAEAARSLAEFRLADGRSVQVPSIIHPPAEQVRQIEDAGLIVDEIRDVPLSALAGAFSAPKLAVLAADDSSVVTGYRTRRA